ncbi:MAG TPA: hypothetical protein ENG00_00205 [Candidatus Aenigmarchaeota archaeon]|nr:hypothetical protein [Candidatus Aenigmarchaeota archaeon]
MGKFEIVDDCLAPVQFMYLEYSGANPFGVYLKIAEDMQRFFEISSSGYFEDFLMWDKSGKDISFFIRMKARRKLSAFTKMFVHMHIRGTRSKEVNKGKFTLRLNSYLETKFQYSNPILRAFWWIYSYIFYDNVRRNYIEFCANTTRDFINEIKAHYNLKIPESVE